MTPEARWQRFHAADYGQLAARHLALALVHDDDVDAALAVWFARRAAHFGLACLRATLVPLAA